MPGTVSVRPALKGQLPLRWPRPSTTAPACRTDETGQLAEAPGHVHRQHSAVALLQGDVAQVVGKAAEALSDAGVTEIQEHVEAQGLEGGKV